MDVVDETQDAVDVLDPVDGFGVFLNRVPRFESWRGRVCAGQSVADVTLDVQIHRFAKPIPTRTPQINCGVSGPNADWVRAMIPAGHNAPATSSMPSATVSFRAVLGRMSRAQERAGLGRHRDEG